MSFNWKIISDKIYAIVKGSAKNLVMYDAKGNETIDPEQGTRFFASFSSHNPDLDDFTILVAIHDQGQSSYINIKTPELKDDTDFERVYKVRNLIRKTVGQREGIKTVWQVFDHAIDPREEAVHNIKESKDVSKLTGTTRSSFQKIGEARLIIRHTDVVNEEKHGARTRHIRAIFVENAQGERFAFPYAYIAGARAFARHISKGGTNSDTIAESIKTISGDYVGLRRAAHFMRQRQVVSEWIVCLREKMDQINKSMRGVAGPKTYENAQTILANSQSVILDETATANILKILAEKCSCGGEDPQWGDLGVAAKYLTGVNMEPEPVSFSWNRRPNISAVPDDREVLERLHWQISELADACASPHTAARLTEIAEMIANNIKPSNEDIALVREAIASSLNFTETDTIPEEKELEEYLDGYTPESIFSEETADEGWSQSRPVDTERYQERPGLEGPFMTKSGKTVYYDPTEGKYYDPDSDFYIDYDDYRAMTDESADTVDEAYLPGVHGEVIANTGDYVLSHYKDRYDSRTVKNEYEVYQKTGEGYTPIENLNMPYKHPAEAIDIFMQKYAKEPNNEGLMESLIRLKKLSGL